MTDKHTMVDTKADINDAESIASIGDSAEWDFVDDIDNKLATDKSSELHNNFGVTANDNVSNYDAKVEDNHGIEEKLVQGYELSDGVDIDMYGNRKDKGTSMIKYLNYSTIARTITTLIFIYYSYTLIKDYVYTQRINNMVGTVDYFPPDSKYIQMYMDKCSEVYDHNKRLLDSCIEAGSDSNDCLNQYLSLINEHKEFCNWDKSLIESQQKAHIRYIKFLGALDKLTMASKNYVEKIPEVLLVGGQQSYKLGGNLFSILKVQFSKSTNFIKKNINIPELCDTSKKVYDNNITKLANIVAVWRSASKGTINTIYKDADKILGNSATALCSGFNGIGESLNHSFNYITEKINGDIFIVVKERVQNVYNSLRGLF